MQRFLLYMFLLLGIIPPVLCTTTHVHSKRTVQLPIMIGVVGVPTSTLCEVVTIMKNDFSFSGQCAVTVKLFNQNPTASVIKQLAQEGFLLAVFINEKGLDAFEWRLYDTYQLHMVYGKRYNKIGNSVRGWAHNLSDIIWPYLSGQEGFFSTKIAFCKDVPYNKCKTIKHIYIADYDGSNQQILVSTPTVNIAPRWNNDPLCPLIFYSEYTDTNVRLVTSTMKRKRTIASNFDGINMLPTFSSDGKRVVYCLSHGKGNCQLYYADRGVFRQLTHNNGNNISPTFARDDAGIYFCADFKTGIPLLYYYDMKTQDLTCVVSDGYCSAPQYHRKRKKLIYSKMVNKTLQLFLYDEYTKQHIQLTFDEGNKEESAWSPCGNYIIYAWRKGLGSRIMQRNLLTNEQRFLTDSSDICSYPSWSQHYMQYPVI